MFRFFFRKWPFRIRTAEEAKLDEQEVIDYSEAGRTQRRVNTFLKEKVALENEIQDNYFRLMLGADVPCLDFIKQLGELDQWLPSKNMGQFHEMLEYLWRRVAETDSFLDMKTVLDTLCGAFPNYERVILKSAYIAYESGLLDCDYEFAILLNRIADYEEIDDAHHFSTNIDRCLPLDEQEPVINICERYGEIINMLDYFSPIADIVRTLEYRFGINHELLNLFACEKIDEFFSTYTISELNMMGALEEIILKVPEGYFLFCKHSTQVMRGYTERDLTILKEKCGIDVKILFEAY